MKVEEESFESALSRPFSVSGAISTLLESGNEGDWDGKGARKMVERVFGRQLLRF